MNFNQVVFVTNVQLFMQVLEQPSRAALSIGALDYTWRGNDKLWGPTYTHRRHIPICCNYQQETGLSLNHLSGDNKICRSSISNTESMNAPLPTPFFLFLIFSLYSPFSLSCSIVSPAPALGPFIYSHQLLAASPLLITTIFLPMEWLSIFSTFVCLTHVFLTRAIALSSQARGHPFDNSSPSFISLSKFKSALFFFAWL